MDYDCRWMLGLDSLPDLFLIVGKMELVPFPRIVICARAQTNISSFFPSASLVLWLQPHKTH